MQQITYKLEGEIASKKTELNALLSSVSNFAPMVMQINAELDSLKRQLEVQRGRLTNRESLVNTEEEGPRDLSVGEILVGYSDLRINLELALQSFTSSQISLEKSQIEAYRQLNFLVIIESATLPEDESYPTIPYNLTLFLCVLLMIFGIGKIILATVDELR
jgi:capsular polysaccharide transport system permease protein